MQRADHQKGGSIKTSINQSSQQCPMLLDDLRDCADLSFNLNQLRPFQEQTILALMSGRDALVVQPTAAGKSLCYQLPALMLGRLVLVISPLISLMEQQSTALHAGDLTALHLTSEMNALEARRVEDQVRSGRVDLLFVAPERLNSSFFQSLFASSPLGLIAVDEAHCLTTWGHDFRPDYVMIDRFLASYAQRKGTRPPIVALTATADRQTRQQIAQHLDLKDPHISIASPLRENLFFSTGYRRQGYTQVKSLIRDRFTNQRGIIYCPTRDLVEKLTVNLNQNAVKALPYHAGLKREVRSQNQRFFEQGAIDIVIATLAFGMGIDAPDLGFVLRLGLPNSLEAFLQEAGRAGRDGRNAEVLLLYNERDAAWAWKQRSESEPHSTNQPNVPVPNGMPSPEEHDRLKEQSTLAQERRLEALLALLAGKSCLKALLQAHFDLETPTRPRHPSEAHKQNSQNFKCHCPHCSGQSQPADLKDELCFILKQIQQNCPGYVTAGQLLDVAEGKISDSIKRFSLDQLDVFGTLRDESRPLLKACLRDLIAERYLDLDLQTQAIDFP